MTYTLNIFTNAHETAPSPLMVQKTYKSFCDTFGHVKPIIWIDPHPNTKHARKYIQNLRNQFSDVRETKSLSDGYVRSIRECETDYLIQLEGDWVFNREHITHSLDEIFTQMADMQIYHFRFNKRENKIAVWDKRMVEKNTPVPYCESNNLSNNPHIINRQFYIDNLLKYIKIVPGSKGIEEIGYFYPARVAGDSDFLDRASAAGLKIKRLNKVLYLRRKHDNSLTRDKKTGICSPYRKTVWKEMQDNFSIYREPVTCEFGEIKTFPAGDRVVLKSIYKL